MAVDVKVACGTTFNIKCDKGTLSSSLVFVPDQDKANVYSRTLKTPHQDLTLNNYEIE